MAAERKTKLGLGLVVLALVGGVAVGVWSTAALESRAYAQENATLTETMKQLDEAFRQVRRLIRDEASRDEALALLSQMQALAVRAKAMQPAMDGVPAEQQAARSQAYRLRMVQLVRAMLDAEAAVLESRHADAYEQLKAMQAIKMEGHQEFRIED